MTETLTCFKSYDIRGELGLELNQDIAYRIGRAAAQSMHARSLVLGCDARETSPELADAVAKGAMDAGTDVLDLGLCGTEEMYWAVTQYDACLGIEVTASHNPIHYNGMKIVQSGSKPLTQEAFWGIKALAEAGKFVPEIFGATRRSIADAARAAYVEKLLSFVDPSQLAPLKIVVNAGNGAAGPTFDALAERIVEGSPSVSFVRVHHTPDPSFPNGIPNPLLPENHAATADVVRSEGADFGIAFDGDFDRCFFFDEQGTFIPGEYVVALLAEAFSEKEAQAKIIHDPRVMWNTIATVENAGGTPIASKTGHAFIKEAMRKQGAVYGGEMSAHHYFRDFAYCDSGMIPWLLIWELVSKSGKTLGALVQDYRERFPSSGEINFTVKDATACLSQAEALYGKGAQSVDHLDGVSIAYETWRFNLRKSNTEPLVRLNLETRGDQVLLREKTEELRQFIEGVSA